MGKYDDIINLPHHVSKKHPQMSLEARAAQFAPFAAVTGHKEEIDEAERVTEEKEDISEEQMKILNKKLSIIMENIAQKPSIKVIYFIPDKKKSGGKYETITGNVKKVDEYKKVIILEKEIVIPMQEIVDISGDLFKQIYY